MRRARRRGPPAPVQPRSPRARIDPSPRTRTAPSSSRMDSGEPHHLAPQLLRALHRRHLPAQPEACAGAGGAAQLVGEGEPDAGAMGRGEGGAGAGEEADEVAAAGDEPSEAARDGDRLVVVERVRVAELGGEADHVLPGEEELPLGVVARAEHQSAVAPRSARSCRACSSITSCGHLALQRVELRRGGVARARRAPPGRSRFTRAGPVGHHHHPVGEVDRLLDPVRDEDDGLPERGPDPQQLVLQVAAGERVERAEGFVHEQHGRIDGEHAGDGDALAHAAGEVLRIARRGTPTARAGAAAPPPARGSRRAARP